MKKSFALFITVFALFIGFSVEAKVPKYVFLFIGDGLSFPQRMAAQEYFRLTAKRELLINKLPVQSATTTRAADQFITDSAASGTAIACGEKTAVGRIGLDVSGKRRLESVAEVAKKNGRKVAIITSVTLNHATPASFYGHQLKRNMGYELGLDLIASGFDYFGGGGISQNTGRNKKQPDVYALAARAGYKVCRNPDEVRAFTPGKGKVIAIGAPGALPYALDKQKNDLRLADFVRQAISHCDNPNGFFMMCEGGAIDWLCHANDAAGTFNEVLEFDDAVQVAFDFYQKHPDDTLIVITGDHETGGLTLGFAGTKYKSYYEVLAGQKYSVVKLNEVMPKTCGSWLKMREFITSVSGLIFNDGTPGAKDPRRLSVKEERALEKEWRKAYPNGKLNAKAGEAFVRSIVRLINNKAGLAWSTGAHTALPVNTSAIGVGADKFSGVIDNTDIARKLKQAVVPVSKNWWQW